MSEYPIADVHRLLDKLDEFMTEIEALPERVQVYHVPLLAGVILELLGWTSTAYIENNLGISPSILSKFIKMRGAIRKSDVRIIADRVRSYLRSQDQATKTNQAPGSASLRKIVAKSSTFTTAPPLALRGEQWVLVPVRSDIKLKIGAISAMLDSIVLQVSRSNAPDEDQALSAIERAELIAILETTLAVLRAPMIEKGLLKQAGEALRKGSEKAVEKGVQDGVGSIMGAARDRLLELIGLLF